jgi:GH24 family phage-related lysozyme (muramidase)
MHPSVRAQWHAFSEPFEGRVHGLYVDVIGFVTTGVGNLVDPIDAALALPWKLPDGSLASESQIRADWERVKSDSERLKRLNHTHALELTTIRLTDEDIDELVRKRLAEHERYFVRTFTRFDDMPADAQLGIHSLAWAVGPGFTQKFPSFTAAALAGNWRQAAAVAKIREDGNPGVVPRNKANRLCFENAAAVIESGADRSVLHWPNAFSQSARTPAAPGKPSAPIDPGVAATALSGALDIAREATREARDRELSGLESPSGAASEHPKGWDFAASDPEKDQSPDSS